MKTAEEWFKEFEGWGSAGDWTEWVKMVQLDAWKQGMTDASEIARTWSKANPIKADEFIRKVRDKMESP